MDRIAPDTCGLRDLSRGIRDAIRATTRPDRPPGSPACLVHVFPDGPGLGAQYPLGSGPVVSSCGSFFDRIELERVRETIAAALQARIPQA